MTESPGPEAVPSPAPTDPPAGPRTPADRALLIVVFGLTLSGVFVGALWAWIAPSIHAVVAVSRKGERVHDYLGNESQNFFVAPFLLVGLLGVVAVVASVAAWQWRDHRGPQMVVALTFGLIGAAAAAAGVGALLVRLRYGTLDFDTVALSSGEHSLTYVQQAPPVFFGHLPLQIAATLLSPTATAALVYALLATGTVRDDLGAYPPVNSRLQPTPQVPAAPLT
ncbi:hypothetical protein A5634_23595 [Mycobacterium asiaticum]|uniref:DUF2567 domain-containing protein n=1 Tax=Mycobacterium asiaticum TaxID=1790 RepID=A0A1A3P1M6_MYCAS|nr:DUF2567 domain-containing protein [Mycobacterium asiaticum]OBK27174.1 hypothetical protein A5634_23595 [Mycobacterium asiaticum]